MSTVETVSRVFFPLATNAGWYRSEGLLDELDAALKMASVLFDEVVLEDGVYEFVATENGCIELPTPVLTLEERARLRLTRSGEPFRFGVATSANGPFSPLLRGPTVARLRVDFYPVIARAGLGDPVWLQWVQGQLTGEAREALQPAIDRAQRDEDRARALPVESEWERGAVVKHWFSDSMKAAALGAAMSMDLRAAAFVRSSTQVATSRHVSAEPGSLVVDGAFGVQMPCFGQMTWEQIVTVRDSASGKSFREMLNRVRSRVASAVPDGATHSDLVALVARELHVELFREMSRFMQKPTATVVNFALNFVPALGMVGTIADLVAHLQQERSWIAFLKA